MIGISFRAVVASDVAHEKLAHVTEELRAMPGVHWLSVTTGRFDIIAIVWCRSPAEFFNFIQR